MSENHRTDWRWDNRLGSFTAELTSGAYHLVLRRGLKGSWLRLELDLWRTLDATVEKWVRQRPSAWSASEADTWRERFLADLTDSALSVALTNGMEGSAVELESSLSRTFRLAFRRRSRAT